MFTKLIVSFLESLKPSEGGPASYLVIDIGIDLDREVQFVYDMNFVGLGFKRVDTAGEKNVYIISERKNLGEAENSYKERRREKQAKNKADSSSDNL